MISSLNPKKDAIPTVFSNLPSYYIKKSETRRSGLSVSSSRHQNEAARLEERCEAFLNANKVENLDELITKLTEDQLYQKYLLHRTDKGAYLISDFALSSVKPNGICKKQASTKSKDCRKAI